MYLYITVLSSLWKREVERDLTLFIRCHLYNCLWPMSDELAKS